MTNTWRTNYKASQGGTAKFRYSLQPCNPLDLKLKQRGAEREMELVAVASRSSQNIEQLFRLKGRIVLHYPVSNLLTMERDILSACTIWGKQSVLFIICLGVV